LNRGEGGVRAPYTESLFGLIRARAFVYEPVFKVQ